MCCYIPVYSCCFCADLSTGAKVIAFLGIVYGIVGITISAAVDAVVAPYFSGAFFELFFSCLLFYGVTAKEPGFVVAWLVAAMIEIVGYFIGALYFASIADFVSHVEVPQDDQNERFKDLAGEASGIVAAIFLALGLLYSYLWAVVCSFLRQFKRGIDGDAGGIGMV